MEAELNDFFEKLDKNKLDEENRTKEIKFNIDDIKIDFFKQFQYGIICIKSIGSPF